MIGGLAALGFGRFELKEGFAEYWELCADNLSRIRSFAAPYAKSEDPIALRVLELSGLVDVREIAKGQRGIDEAAGGFAALVHAQAGG